VCCEIYVLVAHKDTTTMHPNWRIAWGKAEQNKTRVVDVVLIIVVRPPIRMLGQRKLVQRRAKKRHDYGYPIEAHGQDIQATKEM
jgi:hypothetical protein